MLQRPLAEEPDHPILAHAWRYEIVTFLLERDPEDGSEPYLDLTLRYEHRRRKLRFWSPVDLEIERGGPRMTSGLVIKDIRARGLEGLGVQVDDFEASQGSVRFLARAVEEIVD